MSAGTIPDAVREGHPAVITVGVILLVLAVAVVYLTWGRRTIKPKPGSLTVDTLKARLAKEADEIQSKIREAREAEFTRLAEANAKRNLDEAETQVFSRIPSATPEPVTAEIPIVPAVAVPQQRTTRLSSKRCRPYAGLKPRPYPTSRPRTLA